MKWNENVEKVSEISDSGDSETGDELETWDSRLEQIYAKKSSQATLCTVVWLPMCEYSHSSWYEYEYEYEYALYCFVNSG